MSAYNTYLWITRILDGYLLLLIKQYLLILLYSENITKLGFGFVLIILFNLFRGITYVIDDTLISLLPHDQGLILLKNIMDIKIYSKIIVFITLYYALYNISSNIVCFDVDMSKTLSRQFIFDIIVILLNYSFRVFILK